MQAKGVTIQVPAVPMQPGEPAAHGQRSAQLKGRFWPEPVRQLGSAAPPTRREYPSTPLDQIGSRPAGPMPGHQLPAGIYNNSPQGNYVTPQILSMGRWPGPPALGIVRMFQPALGALGGARERGHRQDNYMAHVPVADPRPWVKQITRSLTSTAQKYYGRRGGKGIPATFVPTTLATGFRQRGNW